MSPATTATVCRNTSTNAALVVTLASSGTNEATGARDGHNSSRLIHRWFPDRNPRRWRHRRQPSGDHHRQRRRIHQRERPSVRNGRQSAGPSCEQHWSPGFGRDGSDFRSHLPRRQSRVCPRRLELRDAVYVGADAVNKGTLVAEYTNRSALAVGGFFEQTQQFVAPLSIGQYWFTIGTDVCTQMLGKSWRTTISVSPPHRSACNPPIARRSRPTRAAATGSPITGSGQALRFGTRMILCQCGREHPCSRWRHSPDHPGAH